MKTLLKILIFFMFTYLFISCKKEEHISIFSPHNYLDNPDFIRDGLIGYYPFNGNTKNYFGNAADAIASDPTFSFDRYNDSSGAIHFNGIDEFAQIPNIGKELVDNKGTIIIWCKFDLPHSSYNQLLGTIFSIVDYTNTSLLLSSSGGNLQYRVGNFPKLGGGSVLSKFSKEEFKFFLLTFTDNSITMYDYTKDHFTSQTLSHPEHSLGFNEQRKNQDLYLGKSFIDDYDSETFDNFFTYFKGSIDDLLLYNRILTEEEIKLLFKLAND